VSFCESDPRVAEWLAGGFCTVRGTGASPRKEQQTRKHPAKERVACPRKCRRRPRVEYTPICYGQGSPSSLTSGRKSCGPRGKNYERGPRRAAERKEGPQVNHGPRGGCPYRPGQPNESCLTVIQDSRESKGPHKRRPRILAGIKGLIEGASILVLRGCANNRRRTRGAWASAEGSHCSASANPERTAPSEPGDPEPSRTFVSRHSDHLIIVSKLRVGPKPLPHRDLSSQDSGRAERSRSSIKY